MVHRDRGVVYVCVKLKMSMVVHSGKLFQLLGLARCHQGLGVCLTRTLCSSSPPPSEPKQSSFPDDPSSAVEIPEGDERPHMLNVVWRLRSVKRRPYWERTIIKQLMLERNNFPVVHKNIESVNTLLRKVRHLVRIKPLIPKHGLPNGDYESTLLKYNGEFIVRRKLDSVGKEITPGDDTSDSKTDTRSHNVDVRDSESR